MKIEIAQQDIDNAMKDRAFDCAIALGLQQEFAYEIIGSASGWICIGKDYYLGTPEVRRWINDFDRGKPVKPITIELVMTHVPEKYHPKEMVQTSRRLDTRKAPRKPAPQIAACSIARIANSQR